MANGFYSRVYWSIQDDPRFREVISDDRALALWLRLLLASDAAYPVRLPLPHSSKPLRKLVDARLVLPAPGGTYRMRGLDDLRAERSKRGRDAAAVRWQSASNAEALLSRARAIEERELESNPSPPTARGGAELDPTDPLDAYILATGRAARAGALDWLKRLAADHGDLLVAQSLLTEWEIDRSVGTLLGRVETRCATVVRSREKELTNGEAVRQAAETARLRAMARTATPEQREEREVYRKALKIARSGGGFPLPTDLDGARQYVADWEATHGAI